MQIIDVLAKKPHWLIFYTAYWYIRFDALSLICVFLNQTIATELRLNTKRNNNRKKSTFPFIKVYPFSIISAVIKKFHEKWFFSATLFFFVIFDRKMAAILNFEKFFKIFFQRITWDPREVIVWKFEGPTSNGLVATALFLYIYRVLHKDSPPIHSKTEWP